MGRESKATRISTEQQENLGKTLVNNNIMARLEMLM